MACLPRYFRSFLCALAVTSALSTAAQAAVLYAQAPLDAGEAIEAEYSIAGFFGFQNADAFSLAGPSTVTGFRWWGTEVSDVSLFVVRLFDDVATAPDTFDTLGGSIIARPTSLTDSAATPIFEFDLTLSTPLQLDGSAYLSVFLDTDQEFWFWLESAEGDSVSAFRGVDGDVWAMLPPDLAFAVTGEAVTQGVPEPGALALLGIAALAGLAGRRKHAV
ncbi:PEP-CTERM sorting domain-containing protein [Aromatoleum anaerobium]|uniref:PEP-CTERM sorting domain-containing protein n=1 Tax=Aromatoleum anaerobium TaxID=182180 RepID=A0ABX1PKS9_9RHOO|nr:PEP-CTERM sorting domain-containing protein [Aromatoleum anaerobium]MCK0505605.1 PEP-CTERM sorting domain-containing protein [Aromatoleum anaerobium]